MAPVLDFARPHVLRTEAEYNAAVARVDELLRLNPAEASDEWEELRFLSVLIEVYEEENERIEPASPQEIVELMLDQHGMARGDLAEIMGGRSRVSEFFKWKARPLARPDSEARVPVPYPGGSSDRRSELRPSGTLKLVRRVRHNAGADRPRVG